MFYSWCNCLLKYFWTLKWVLNQISIIQSFILYLTPMVIGILDNPQFSHFAYCNIFLLIFLSVQLVLIHTEHHRIITTFAISLLKSLLQKSCDCWKWCTSCQLYQIQGLLIWFFSCWFRNPVNYLGIRNLVLALWNLNCKVSHLFNIT